MALKLQKAESELRTAKAEAELEALRCKKEMEAAIAEAAVLQAELDDDHSLGEPGSELNQRYFTAHNAPPQRQVKLESHITLPNLQSHSLPSACLPAQPPPTQNPTRPPD